MEPDSTAAASAGPPEPLPAEVERLAVARGLGSYESGTREGHPVGSAVLFALGAALYFGIALALDWLAGAVDFGALSWVSVLLQIAALVGGAVLVVHALVRGRRGMYVFSGGLVWTQRSRIESATWPEIDRLVTAGTFRPRQAPDAGVIFTIDGREAFVEFGASAARFHDRLVAAVRAADRPVYPKLSTTGILVPEESIARRFLLPLVASLVLPGVLSLFLALWDAEGLPFGPALYVTFAVSTLAAVLFRQLRYAGVIFAGLAGLFLIIEVNRWSDGSVVLVTAAVIAAQITTVVGWRQLARWLPALRRLGARRRLARDRGWSYQDAAEVPVPGPRSTHQLIGVPTAATATTGAGVLVATANGFECRVYDLVRGRPRLDDRIRTIWQVTLPVSLPGHHVWPDLSAEGLPRTAFGGATQAARILADVYRVVPVPTHPWWWVEGRYLCSWEDVYASPRVILGRMEFLTRLAAGIRWEQLTDPALWRTVQPSTPQPPRSTEPPRPPQPQDASRLSSRVGDALRLAASEAPPGTPLTTGRVFDALARVDPTLDWQRLWLHTGAPEGIGLATAPDPDGGETAEFPGSATGPPLSAQLSRAISVAERIRSRYGHPVVTTGVMALGLVAFRGAGATEALLAGGQMSHAQLLCRIQDDIVGYRFERLRAIIPAAPD